MLDRSYRKLPACRSAMHLAQAVYGLTSHFPDDERSGLTATLRRASASIPTKLAESLAERHPDAAFRAIESALATVRECAAYLDVAERLRLTSRWRFRNPRRRARKAARKLYAMLQRPLKDDHQKPIAA